MAGILAGLGKTILSGAKNTIGANPLGLAFGTGQLVLGAMKKNKGEGMMVPPEDTLERGLFNTLRRQQQAIATGTSSMDKTNALKGALKTLTKNSFSTGGINQGAYNAMLNQGMANITEGTAQQTAQNLAEQRQLATQMANLKNDRTFLQRNETMAAAAELTKAGTGNALASIMPSDQEYKYNELGESPEEARKRKREERNAAKETRVDAAGNPIKG